LATAAGADARAVRRGRRRPRPAPSGAAWTSSFAAVAAYCSSESEQSFSSASGKGLFDHLLLGGRGRDLAGLQLGDADQPLLALLGGLPAPRGQLGGLAVRLGLVLRGHLGCRAAGVGEHLVDLRLGVSVDALCDLFDTVHFESPFCRGHLLILMIISMEASRDRIA
jgi:hypothetical protein